MQRPKQVFLLELALGVGALRFQSPAAQSSDTSLSLGPVDACRRQQNHPRSGLLACGGDFCRGVEIIGLEFRSAVEGSGRIGDRGEMDDNVRTVEQRSQIGRADVGFDELVTPDRGKIEQRGVALSSSCYPP